MRDTTILEDLVIGAYKRATREGQRGNDINYVVELPMTSEQYQRFVTIIDQMIKLQEEPKEKTQEKTITPPERRFGYQLCEKHQQEYITYCCACAIESLNVWNKSKGKM